MAPNVKEVTILEEPEMLEKLTAPQADPNWKYEYIPSMIIIMAYIHLYALYGLYLVTSAKWTTLLFMFIYFIAAGHGLSAGAHRLWSHKAFKVKLPYEILLMLCQSSANQNSAIWWVQNHRQHHKYSDTDGDPINATRGFLFSHIGWLCVKSHPDAVKRRKYIDTTDLKNNPVLQFQKKYAFFIILLMSFIVPLLPVIWGESFKVVWHLNMLRLAISFNLTFAINSVGHAFGNKPYDKTIKATQSDLLLYVTLGDGYHNFHHAFPWDYRSGEFGGRFNFTATVIDAFAKIGWAYDLKSVTEEMAATRARRTGDGSRIASKEE